MSVNRIWIQFYKDVHICGEPVQGSINVACYQPVANAVLKFKLKAYEEAKWVELNQIHVSPEQPLTIPEHQIVKVNDVSVSDDSSDSDEEQAHDKVQPEYIRKGGNPAVYRVVRGEGKYRILGQTQDLGNLTVGHHSFPFQFNSLTEWPGTFHQEEAQAKGKIKYNVIAWYGNFRAKQEFFMQEFKKAESDNLSSEASISSCCCMSKGTVKMDVSFSKDALYIGEEEEVKIDLDCTKLSCNISSVSLNLENTVTFTSDQGHSKSYNESVFSKQATGCQAGQTKKSTEKFSVSFQQKKQNNRPTTNGRIVRSVYKMRVNSGNDASCTCCSSDAGVENGTHIFSRPTNITPVFQDNNWNPSVRQALNVPLLPPVVKPKKYKIVPVPPQQAMNQPHMGGVGVGPTAGSNNNAPPPQYGQPVAGKQGNVGVGPTAGSNNNAPPPQYGQPNPGTGHVGVGPTSNSNNNAPPPQYNQQQPNPNVQQSNGVGVGPTTGGNSAPPPQYNQHVGTGPVAGGNNAPPPQYNQHVGTGPVAGGNSAPPPQYNQHVGTGPVAGGNNAPPPQYNQNPNQQQFNVSVQGGVGVGPTSNSNNNAPPPQYHVGGGPVAGGGNTAPPPQYKVGGGAPVQHEMQPVQQGQQPANSNNALLGGQQQQHH